MLCSSKRREGGEDRGRETERKRQRKGPRKGEKGKEYRSEQEFRRERWGMMERKRIQRKECEGRERERNGGMERGKKYNERKKTK